MAETIAIPLTSEEITGFINRHPFYNFFGIPDGGRYIWDETLNGNILVFKKTDGTVCYIWTSLPMNAVNDPNPAMYTIRETAKALADNTAGLMPTTSDMLKFLYALIILGIVFLIIQSGIMKRI